MVPALVRRLLNRHAEGDQDSVSVGPGRTLLYQTWQDVIQVDRFENSNPSSAENTTQIAFVSNRDEPI